MRLFRICKCAFLSKKIFPVFLGFVSMLFLNISKRHQEKNGVRFFRICKYAFLIFGKEVGKKIASGFLGFVSVLFLNI